LEFQVSGFKFRVFWQIARALSTRNLKLETRNCRSEFCVQQEFAIAFRAQDRGVGVIRLLGAELN